MAKYASGRRSLAISDRSGMAFPYSEMVTEWNGSFVHISEYEPKQPQIRRKRVVADAIALQKVRPQRFQQPQEMKVLNPTFAANDNTIVSSGGEMVGIADLSLPGMFAYSTFSNITTNDGITTSIQSMVPRDPSLQNARRQLRLGLGPVTVSIT